MNHFQTFGFVVLRRFFEPLMLAEEIDRVLHDGAVSPEEAAGSGKIRFRYAPMMTAETPASLSLLERAGAVAADLLGGPVLPTRAKGVRYWGDTPWHQDSTLPVASVGVAAYLEPLGADSGALRVLPGSHRPEFGKALGAHEAAGMAADALPSHAISTEPGDLIFFDEHLFHASSGGGVRRQWRVDYLRDPVTSEAVDHARGYFASIYPPDWDGRYDVDRYPTYGPDWRASEHPWVARLEALGVYELAEKQERFTRSRR
jgi:Phytanoyl-CoA dioxygenase (PhyH)